jgi:anti-sigma factor RsiW
MNKVPENQSPRNRSPYCGDPGALVSYLYNDGSPEELADIAAHVQSCDACTWEIASLGDTREQLVAWSPPQTELGFTITSLRDAALEPVSPVVPKPVAASTPWWRQATPVWMQGVAAAVVFAAGLAVGASGRAAPPAPVPAATAVAASPAVSRGELADLEQRLRAEFTKLSQAAAPAVAQVDPRANDVAHDVLLKRVQTLLTDSEERQRRELALRTAQVMRDIEIQRKVDMATVQQNIGQLQGSTGAELKQQRELYNMLMNNASLRGGVR